MLEFFGSRHICLEPTSLAYTSTKYMYVVYEAAELNVSDFFFS